MTRYGRQWDASLDDLQIKLSCLEQRIGDPFEHFMAARKLLWPNRYRHRWTDLMYHEFIKNDITILLGAASTQKTSHAAEFVLINYWVRPYRTLVIVSTIKVEKLETGVFGEIKMLWRDARRLYPYLEGNLVDSRHCIATDDIEEEEYRDLRKGIIGKPCYSGGKWVGMGELAGTKQDYIFYIADELQFMAESFLGQWPNLFSNGEVKIIGSGNPKHETDDQLGIAAEPRCGWENMPTPTKTTCWETNFLGGRCVNLVGTDSPNFDVPEASPVPYPKLIGYKFKRRIEHDYGIDSPEAYQQLHGVMRVDMALSRVITRQLCREHKALETAIWKDDQRQRAYGLDPAYGGGDRCVGVALEWGEGSDGTTLVRVLDVKTCPVSIREGAAKVEDQIAQWLQVELERMAIKPIDAFWDACGKGTLGSAFARVFGMHGPVAVDPGAMPTRRPVRQDLWLYDEKRKMRRLKECHEHYSKFVSELWFSVRYLIEANQLRELPEDVMAEGCARIYYSVAGNRIEVEPKSDPKKKEDLRRRLGKSPDLFDALTIAVEGARQRGLLIAPLGPAVQQSVEDDDWYTKEARAYQKAIRAELLTHE